jgi:hypothetical protein
MLLVELCRHEGCFRGTKRRPRGDLETVGFVRYGTGAGERG